MPLPPRALRMHSWTKSVYLQTNELFFNRRSLLLHHVVEKPLDEKWNEKAWWNKMHHVSIFARSVAGVDVPPVPTESACEKWILQIYIFSALPVTPAYFIFIHLCFYWMLFNSQSTFPHENNAPAPIHGGWGGKELLKLCAIIIIIFIYVCAQRVEKNHEPWVHNFQNDIINALHPTWWIKTFFHAFQLFRAGEWAARGIKFRSDFNLVIFREYLFLVYTWNLLRLLFTQLFPVLGAFCHDFIKNVSNSFSSLFSHCGRYRKSHLGGSSECLVMTLAAGSVVDIFKMLSLLKARRALCDLKAP